MSLVRWCYRCRREKERKRRKKGAETTLFPHELHNLRYHCLLACYAVFSYILPIPEKTEVEGGAEEDGRRRSHEKALPKWTIANQVFSARYDERCQRG